MRLATLLFLAFLLVSLSEANAQTLELRDAPWTITEISADGQTLQLEYEGGGCARRDGFAVVSEANNQVDVRVRQNYTVVPYNLCTQELRCIPLSVRLAEPVRGRLVTGGPDFFQGPCRMGVTGGMPRLIGLNTVNARRVLQPYENFRTIIFTGEGTVTSQSPAPGVAVPPETPILIGVNEIPAPAVPSPPAELKAVIDVPAKVRRLRRRAVTVARITCPADVTCAVAAPQQTRVRIRRRYERLRVQARKQLGPGEVADVRLRLTNREARRLAGRKVRVSIPLTATTSSGASVTSQVKVTIRAPRRA